MNGFTIKNFHDTASFEFVTQQQGSADIIDAIVRTKFEFEGRTLNSTHVWSLESSQISTFMENIESMHKTLKGCSSLISFDGDELYMTIEFSKVSPVERMQIEKPFRKARVVRWNEIRRIDGRFEKLVKLYLADGTKILTADIGMVNYDVFCNVLRARCPGGVKEYYEDRLYEKPGKCVMRYGSEYYLLAVMGILIFAMYMAFMVNVDVMDVVRELQGPAGRSA